MSLNITFTQNFIVPGCSEADSRYLVTPPPSPYAVAVIDSQGDQDRRAYPKVLSEIRKIFSFLVFSTYPLNYLT